MDTGSTLGQARGVAEQEPGGPSVAGGRGHRVSTGGGTRCVEEDARAAGVEARRASPSGIVSAARGETRSIRTIPRRQASRPAGELGPALPAAATTGPRAPA